MTVTTIEVHGKQFNVEKRDGEWQTNYRNAKATTGKSKNDVIASLRKYGKAKLVKACDGVDKYTARDLYFKAHAEDFTSIFGFAPPRDFLFYHMGMGLSMDVIKLDKHLHTPDGISTNDYIKNTFGDYALEIVQKMI